MACRSSSLKAMTPPDGGSLSFVANITSLVHREIKQAIDRSTDRLIVVIAENESDRSSR